MKKLINKLFEWLGYKLLSQKEYDAMNLTLRDVAVMIIKDRINHIKQDGVSQIVEEDDGYMVLRECYAIKFFPFNNDKEYAKLCAEELCDMLNEKI